MINFNLNISIQQVMVVAGCGLFNLKFIIFYLVILFFLIPLPALLL